MEEMVNKQKHTPRNMFQSTPNNMHKSDTVNQINKQTQPTYENIHKHKHKHIAQLYQDILSKQTHTY